MIDPTFAADLEAATADACPLRPVACTLNI
jgi:hypothetical protein